jgi:flap endonuclease-1
MGLDLKPLITPSYIKLTDLSNRTIAVDAFNTIYQFLATIRGSTGELLTNSKGEVTSHLSGLFYRNINLLAENIKLVYVFDGKPSHLKFDEIERRQQVKQVASEKFEEALTEGRFDDARKYGQATSVLTDKMVMESKMLLSFLGVPTIQAPSEGEATAAYLSNTDKAYTCASQDYDSILFGAKRLTRNLTISGKRKVPNKNAYIDVVPEMFYFEDIVVQTHLTRAQLIDIGILIGTDFNPGGIPGIGPKTALKLIQRYAKLENIDNIKEELSKIPYDEIRELFLRPEVADIQDIEFDPINYDKVTDLLCNRMDFSMERFNGALQKLKNSIDNRSQSLERWF